MKWNRNRGIAAVLIVCALGWVIYARVIAPSVSVSKRGAGKPVPVEVSPIQHGAMELKRSFSGTIDARAQFVVAPKISGRLNKLFVDLADMVERGQVVAELDNEEYLQAVAQAEADLQVAQANLAAATSALKIADREMARVKQLQARGLASDTQFDVAMTSQLARQADVEVARANLRKAQALLETSRIQLGYTRVSAAWSNGQAQRIVAERFVDEGDTVEANAALLRVVELDWLTAVIHVTEKDYVNMTPGQTATLTTAAYPGEVFEARIERIAPVFRETTRQARVELAVDNSKHRLKPGMFVRVTVALRQIDNATSVPELALTVREGHDGVFVVDEPGNTVSWKPVTLGVRDGTRVQILGEGLQGKVVTLGQQFLDDGASVSVVK